MEARDFNMEAPQWREEAGGTFVAETAEFIIQVRRTATRQHVRFFVLKRTDVLIGSGTTADIAAAMNAAQEMAGRLTGTRKSDRPRLMVVDHDQEMRGAIADTLRDGGHDVVEAASGEGALRRLERLASGAHYSAQPFLRHGWIGAGCYSAKAVPRDCHPADQRRQATGWSCGE
jgi:CheY-like chemotaxis protein